MRTAIACLAALALILGAVASGCTGPYDPTMDTSEFSVSGFGVSVNSEGFTTISYKLPQATSTSEYSDAVSIIAVDLDLQGTAVGTSAQVTAIDAGTVGSSCTWTDAAATLKTHITGQDLTGSSYCQDNFDLQHVGTTDSQGNTVDLPILQEITSCMQLLSTAHSDYVPGVGVTQFKEYYGVVEFHRTYHLSVSSSNALHNVYSTYDRDVYAYSAFSVAYPTEMSVSSGTFEIVTAPFNFGTAWAVKKLSFDATAGWQVVVDVATYFPYKLDVNAATIQVDSAPAANDASVVVIPGAHCDLAATVGSYCQNTLIVSLGASVDCTGISGSTNSHTIKVDGLIYTCQNNGDDLAGADCTNSLLLSNPSMSFTINSAVFPTACPSTTPYSLDTPAVAFHVYRGSYDSTTTTYSVSSSADPYLSTDLLFFQVVASHPSGSKDDIASIHVTHIDVTDGTNTDSFDTTLGLPNLPMFNDIETGHDFTVCSGNQPSGQAVDVCFPVDLTANALPHTVPTPVPGDQVYLTATATLTVTWKNAKRGATSSFPVKASTSFIYRPAQAKSILAVNGNVNVAAIAVAVTMGSVLVALAVAFVVVVRRLRARSATPVNA